MEKQNQITSKPGINRIGPTQRDPRRVRLYFKNHGATILLAKSVPHEVALKVEHCVSRIMRENGLKLEGVFLQTQ